MSLKKELSKGILITFITKYSNIFIQIILGMILARLLSPKEFGVVAVVQVFVTFINLLSDMGLGPAIIQKKLSKEEISSVFIFSILIGGISSIGFYSLAGFISNFYENEIYIPIVKLLSIGVLFSTFNVVPVSLNRKAQRFKLVGTIGVLTNLAGGVISITLAIKGYSHYSIIFGSIMKNIVSFVLNFYFSRLKFYCRFSLIGIKKVFSYSLYQFLFNFINYFSRNLDNILIGKFLGSELLGFYDKAYKLMLYPIHNLTGIFTPVIHPVLSKYQEDRDLIYRVYSKMVKMLALIGIPLSVYLYFTAEEIILIMYGNNWKESVPVFKILACTVWIQVVMSSSGSIFQVAEKTKHLFISGVISAIIICSAIVYGVNKGTLISIGYGILIAFSVTFLQGYYILISMVLKKSFIKFLQIFIKPILIGCFMIGIFIFYTRSINIHNIYYSFILKSICALIGFTIGMFYTKEYRIFKKIHYKGN